MNFEIVYHDLVISEDIPRLSSAWKDKIRKTIEARLLIQPDLYGKPLRKSLKGYRKLRIEDYRVIFRIEDKTVKIFIIAHRSVVYTKINKRT
jgi:mRNA interferase RelE/StbE